MKKLSLFWILIFTFQVFTQEKAVALKFDEFSYYQNQYGSYHTSEKISDSQRILRFAQEVTKHKESKAYIIFYNQRKDKYPLAKGKTESQETVRILTNQTSYPPYYPNPKYPLSPEKIVVIDGGYRKNATLEFWIVPQNAEPPRPTPTFTSTEIAVCPEINVAGDGYGKDRQQPLKFSVAIKDEEPNSKLSLEWNVSAGKITKGQNTNQIEVDLSNTDNKLISASVQVKGLHPECENHDFASTQVGLYPHKIDEFAHLAYSDLANRMQNGMAVELANDLTATVHIIIYGSRDGNKRNVAIVLKSISRTMDFMKLDRSRIKIIDGGYREEMFVEVYLVPAGVEPPKPTPSLDNIFFVTPKKIMKKGKKTK